MKDLIIRGLLASDTVKVIAISGKGIVEEARRVHGLSRVCTAALGRTLLMTSMMGVQLKNADEHVTTILKGGGMAGNVVCTSYADGKVKGYIENPELELPLTPQGKLDVALAIGWFGDLTVVRDMSMKEPYVGTCAITSGEIAEDFARYYSLSEQQPSMVYLGVRIEPVSGEVRSAGGLIVQPLPDCPDEIINVLTEKAKAVETLSEKLDEGASLEEALHTLFDDMGIRFVQTLEPSFRCDCNRARLEKVIISLGKAEIEDMIEKEHGAEITCHFCNTKYKFSEDELRKLLDEATDHGGQE